MKLYIFGNGNLSFSDFKELYEKQILKYCNIENTEFIICDFKGVDTLSMEVLKNLSSNVSIFHIGEKPRYLSDKFKTKVNDWKIIGGFQSDEERDRACIDVCTHFLAVDFNSDVKRKSGTLKNIELCLELGKISMMGN